MSAIIIPTTFLDRELPPPRFTVRTSLEFSCRTSSMHSTMTSVAVPEESPLMTTILSSGAWAFGSDHPTSSL